MKPDERPQADPDDAIRAAAARLAGARDELSSAVDEARRGGRSWQQIGDVLGVSRQAAFKRFGSPRDPRSGIAMSATTNASDVAEMTDRVFRLLDAGDYEAIAALMTTDCAEVLTKDVVLGTWASVVAEIGNLVNCGQTRAELPDGTIMDPEESVLGSVLGQTLLACEAGECVGRLALDADHRIVGMLLVPPDHGPLPF